ncbi:MAG: hypothetical protein K0S65_1042 [Labilithrix sp.]|nr:hypothetical protein [Labilithrix sp.]
MFIEKQITLPELDGRWRDILTEITTSAIDVVYRVSADETPAARSRAAFVLGPQRICGRVFGLIDAEYGWPAYVAMGDITSAAELAPRHRRHPVITAGAFDPSDQAVVGLMDWEYDAILGSASALPLRVAFVRNGHREPYAFIDDPFSIVFDGGDLREAERGDADPFTLFEHSGEHFRLAVPPGLRGHVTGATGRLDLDGTPLGVVLDATSRGVLHHQSTSLVFDLVSGVDLEELTSLLDSADPTERAFLEALWDDPWDAIQVAVYADWLEENGRLDEANIARRHLDLGPERGAGTRARDALAKTAHAILAPHAPWLRIVAPSLAFTGL